jgi:hypothetical protein
MLVGQLASGSHPVQISIRPERTPVALKACIDRGYVHVKFTDTQGGTELGFSIDHTRSDFGNADFDTGSGSLRLVGGLRLNFTRVICVADISLPSLDGMGHLEIVPEEATS